MTGKLMGIGSLVALASVAGVAEAKPAIRTDADRVKAPLVVDLPQLGTLKARTAAEIGEAGWMIGCECLDRDFADFKAYRDFANHGTDLFADALDGRPVPQQATVVP